MKDRPIVQLSAQTPLMPEEQAWLSTCEQALNHAINVTHREEWELAMAEWRDAFIEFCFSGDLTQYDAAIRDAMHRYERRLSR